MTCPRCGADNPIPEATRHLCHQCGFSLIGEVSRHDIHTLAARRTFLKIIFLLVLLGGLILAGIETHWFGWRTKPFIISTVAQVTTLLAPDSVTVQIASGTVELKPVASFSVNAIVLANQRYGDGALLPLAPRDLIVGWGDLATASRQRLGVTPHDRSVTLTSSDGQFDAKALQTMAAVLHIIPASDAMKKILENLGPGAKIGLEGLTVSTNIGGQKFEATTPSPAEGEPPGYLLYVTSVTLKGKTTEFTVTQ